MPEIITVERPGEQPLNFPGCLVASANGEKFNCGDDNSCVDWFELYVYEHEFDDSDPENYVSPFDDGLPPHELENEVVYVLVVLCRSRLDPPETERRFVTMGGRDMLGELLPYLSITELPLRDPNDEKLVESLKLQFTALVDEVFEQA